MARKQSHIPQAVSPNKVDDFRLIKGVGPAQTARLHQAGIMTFHQLATLSPEELAAQVSGLSVKQVTSQDWTGQARKLASKSMQPRPSKIETPKQKIHQHYENFTLELLLDDRHSVRRTRVAHIQSGDADTWAGWEAAQLVDFLARHAGIRIPTLKSQNQEFPASRVPSKNSNAAPEKTSVKNQKPPQPPLDQVKQVVPGNQITRPYSQSLETVRPTESLCIRSLEIITPASPLPVRFLHQEQEYMVRTTLDTTDDSAPRNPSSTYKLIILSRQLGGASHPIGEKLFTLNALRSVTLDIPGIHLLPGTYRLEAFVEIRQGDALHGFAANFRGDLLQIY